MSGYTWAATGGTILGRQDTSVVQVKWDCNPATAAHLSVNYTNFNGCTASAATDSTIVLATAPQPTISGEVSAASGGYAAYMTEAGMTNYQWTVEGGKILSGQDAYYISVQWNYATAQGTLAVSYTNSNGCTVSSAPADNTVTIEVLPNIDASLNALTLSAGVLVPTFHPDSTAYTASVGNSVSQITLAATPNDANVSDLTGAGLKNLSVGQNVFPIAITSENGAVTKTYTITVTRAKSSDAALQDLTVSYGTLSFAPNTFSYQVDVENSVSSATITGTAAHVHATVEGDGMKNLQTGHNAFDVVVTAEDGISTQTYTVDINRARSSDAALQSITISAGELDFAPNTLAYTIAVAHNVANLTIAATPHSGQANVNGNVGTQTLSYGSNVFTISVLAEDDATTRTYTLTVNRATPSADATLSTLTVNTGTLTPAFSAEVLSYMVTVHCDTASILLNATANHAGAGVAGDGGKALVTGANPFAIQVTAENGSVATYNVTVVREIDMMLQAEIDRLRIDSATLQVANTSLQTEVSGLVSDTLRLYDAKVALQAQRQALQADSVQKKNTIATLNNHISTLQADSVQKKNTIATLNAEIAALTQRINTLQQDSASLQAQLATCNSGSGNGNDAALQTQSNNLHTQLSTLQNEKADWQGQLNTANSNVSNLQTHLSTANANIATLTQDLNSCRAGGGTTAVATPVTAVLHVYPNPVQNGDLIIDDPQLELDGKVEVYALNGGLVDVYDVSAGAQTIINISRLATGTYIVKAGNKAAKVVKQ
jgi:predicted  nucleic acid-binding Zn-ribbon protein